MASMARSETAAHVGCELSWNPNYSVPNPISKFPLSSVMLGVFKRGNGSTNVRA